MSAPKPYPQVLRGRLFTAEDVDLIRCLVATNPGWSRRALSIEVCSRLDWRQPNGRWKDRACRVALLELQRQGLIVLPPPRIQWAPRREPVPHTSAGEPKPGFEGPLSALTPLSLCLVSDESAAKTPGERVWDELVDRYHFLGYQPIIGPQLKYLIESPRGVLGCIGFGAAAWSVRARDEWIGWSAAERQRNLHCIVNNGRFLLAPWFRVPHLASHVLGLALRTLPKDWIERYHVRPLLVETFVHRDRHRGTSYAAANWRLLGETTGRGKWDRHTRRDKPVKLVYVYPLVRHPRRHLRDP